MAEDTSFSSVYNFIVNFKPEEIDEVILDFKHQQEGIKFLYALDTFDIIAHYLPFIEEGFFQAENKNILAQRLICYDYFFDSKVDKKIIILDEYKLELLSAKNRIQKQLKDTRNILKTLNQLKEDTAVFTERGPEADEYFEKNFEVILLLLILSEKKDFIHLEFEDFLKHKLTINNIKTGSPSDDSVLDQIFGTTTHSELTGLLFKEYVEDNRFDLLKIPIPEERYVYLENTYRDVQAVDRILSLNEKLTVGTDYLVTYLSSTPTKTNRIFRSLKKIAKKEQVLSPGKYRNITIHRNIFQCFLYDILNNEFSADKASIDEALQSLKKLAAKLKRKESYKESVDMYLEPGDLPVMARLKNIFDVYSANLDNHFYVKIYEKYRRLHHVVHPVNQKKDTEGNVAGPSLKDVDIMEIFAAIDHFLNQENFKSKLFDVTLTITQLKQALEITDIYDVRQQLLPNVNFGSDIIKNNFHHLPYLVFADNNFKSKLVDRLCEFLNELIVITHPEDLQIEALPLALKKVINELSYDTKGTFREGMQQIVIAYINLITTSSTTSHLMAIKELEIIKVLEKQKHIANAVIMEPILQRDEEGNNPVLKVQFKDSIYSKEIDYILLWLYRRNERIEDGIALGKSMIKDYPEDARYYHGLGLCYIARSYQTIFQDQTNEHDAQRAFSDLDAAILYLKRSKEYYEKLINTILNRSLGALIEKNYIAVLNALADISIRKYKIALHKEFSVVEEAKHFFETLKQLCSDLNIVYQDSVTFLGTEVEIEYFEALELFNNKKLQDAHTKILSAVTKSALLDEKARIDITHRKFRETKKLITELFGIINKALRKHS